jgi:methyl-accepting chemotaxis protein
VETHITPGQTNNPPQPFTKQASNHPQDRLYMVRNLSMVLTMSAAGTMVTGFWTSLAGSTSIWVGIGWAVASAIFFTAYLVARFGQWRRTADYTICLQVSGVQAVVTLVHLQPKPGHGVLVLLLIVPVLVGVLDFKGIFRYIFNLCTAILLVGLFVFSESIRLAEANPQPAEFDTSGLAYLLLAYMVVIPIVAIFVRRQNQATQLATGQADQLKELVQTLAFTTEFGASISRDLVGVTSQLSVTSHQQASSGQQLAAAMSQVTSSLEELNETTNQIASVAENTSHSGHQAVQIASEVKESSKLAATSGLEGRQAVAQANQSVAMVGNRIELLGQRLLYLINLTGRTGTIVELLDEIADETHLLALNASIEAAGTEGNSNERFGVIATEIKNLSERSRESTEEVRQALQEMQGAVAAAVLVAEEGKKETSNALLRSNIAGMVIDKLNQVIDDNAKQAEKILSAAQAINQRAEVINLATGQQRSASQQLLTTMRQISEVAQQAAGSVGQLSSMSIEVNQQIDELNLILAKSGQTLEPVMVGL